MKTALSEVSSSGETHIRFTALGGTVVTCSLRDLVTSRTNRDERFKYWVGDRGITKEVYDELQLLLGFTDPEDNVRWVCQSC